MTRLSTLGIGDPSPTSALISERQLLPDWDWAECTQPGYGLVPFPIELAYCAFCPSPSDPGNAEPELLRIGVLVFRPDGTPLGYLICLMHASRSSGSCELEPVRDGTVQRVLRPSGCVFGMYLRPSCSVYFGCVTIGPGDFARIVMEPEARYIR